MNFVYHGKPSIPKTPVYRLNENCTSGIPKHHSIGAVGYVITRRVRKSLLYDFLLIPEAVDAITHS